MSALLETFGPLFDDIAADARRRDRDGEQPYDAVRRLADAGFGAIRVPVDAGGGGASIAEQHDLLIELAAADSNLPQIWRNHFAFVEDVLGWAPSARADLWRSRIVAGAFVGGAWSETGGTSMLDLRTTVAPHGDGYAVDGTKFYSTGSLFADWISVLAKGPQPEQLSLALVARDQHGVSVFEDWDGIGQRLTGSGTSTFDGAVARDLYPFEEHSRYQEAFYQLNHLATLAGITRAVHRELVVALRARTRAYPQGLASAPRDDAQLQQLVGRVAALAASAAASVHRAAARLDTAAEAITGGDHDSDETSIRHLHEATVAVYEAQLIVTDQALEASTIAFDALSSSALRIDAGLDRHWRNARTVASHNPRVYKARIVGDWHVNGTDPIAALWGGGALAVPAASEVPATTPLSSDDATTRHYSKEHS